MLAPVKVLLVRLLLDRCKLEARLLFPLLLDGRFSPRHKIRVLVILVQVAVVPFVLTVATATRSRLIMVRLAVIPYRVLIYLRNLLARALNPVAWRRNERMWIFLAEFICKWRMARWEYLCCLHCDTLLKKNFYRHIFHSISSGDKFLSIKMTWQADCARHVRLIIRFYRYGICWAELCCAVLCLDELTLYAFGHVTFIIIDYVYDSYFNSLLSWPRPLVAHKT